MDSAMSDVSSADGAPIGPGLMAALTRLAAPDAPAAPTFTVEPDPKSVTAARHFAAATVRGWGLAGLCDDIALVASELVTNALRHSLPACPHERAPASIRLRLLRAAPYVLCGVADASPSVPRRREPDYIAETGRGLHIVESFSTWWGWMKLPPSGKIVWAVFER